MKYGAPAHSTFGPDPPPMAGNNALHIREADACAFKFIMAMQTLEYAEDFIHIFHVESCSVIRDGTSDFITLIFASDFDLSLRTRTGELDCIGDEINHHKS